MLVGLISDIHANLEGLEACLARCEAMGIQKLAILGDLVGYGPDPEAVVQRVIGLAALGALVVRGNHDEAVLSSPQGMNPVAAEAIRWTAPRLSETSRNFLAALPLQLEMKDSLLVHAEPADPASWHYITSEREAHQSLAASRAAVTFCGHVHVPQLYCLTATAKVVGHRPVTGVPIPLMPQRRWLGVIGAAGQPRDGNPAAAFAVYDTASRNLTFARAAYDVETTAAKIRAAGLPERLAVRLLQGH